MHLEERLFSISNEDDFNQVALEVFHYQAQHTAIYRQFIQALHIQTQDVKHYTQIPFLPIEFFKTHRILADQQPTAITFSSSGTTGMTSSKHAVAQVSLYEKSYNNAFEKFYGSAHHYAVLALLPSYLERTGSSLIYMVEDLIGQSKHPESGFFLHNHQDLADTLQKLKTNHTPTILFGVSFALLDFLETYRIDFPELIIMETGGMKGRRKEMIREELHGILTEGFGVKHIHSEYGMTELLSQAYSKGNGIFEAPNWMKIMIRDTNDPLSWITEGKTGAINVIDLANLYSCSFIATQDLGRSHTDGSFEVLGRFDNSDIRGCNLLVQ